MVMRHLLINSESNAVNLNKRWTIKYQKESTISPSTSRRYNKRFTSKIRQQRLNVANEVQEGDILLGWAPQTVRFSNVKQSGYQMPYSWEVRPNAWLIYGMIKMGLCLQDGIVYWCDDSAFERSLYVAIALHIKFLTEESVERLIIRVSSKPGSIEMAFKLLY